VRSVIARHVIAWYERPHQGLDDLYLDALVHPFEFAEFLGVAQASRQEDARGLEPHAPVPEDAALLRRPPGPRIPSHWLFTSCASRSQGSRRGRAFHRGSRRRRSRSTAMTILAFLQSIVDLYEPP
jgi:hypothetical protein